MNYDEVVKAARACIGDSCKVCSVCNGMGCRNRIPGRSEEHTSELQSQR